jgi:hypothetical protein
MQVIVYPNPFSQLARIRFSQLKDGPVRAEVLDSNGKPVYIFPMRFMLKGDHELEWDASGAPSGIYIARIYSHGRFNAVKLVKE